MKKLNLFAVCILCLVVTMATVSCSNDDDTTTPEEQQEETTYNYFPLALNNTWDYNFTGGEDIAINLTSMLDFNGSSYYITDFVNPVDGEAMTQGYRLDGSTYYGYNGETELTYVVSGFETTAVIDPAEFVLFDEQMEVDDSVTTNVSVPTTISLFGASTTFDTDFEFTATLEAEGLEMTVSGVTYTDVIKVHLVVNTTMQTSTYEEELDYYFANNIGPIQLESSLGDYMLTSYDLN